jgi:hypothetical protein
MQKEKIKKRNIVKEEGAINRVFEFVKSKVLRMGRKNDQM